MFSGLDDAPEEDVLLLDHAFLSTVPEAIVAAAPKGARVVDTASLTLDEIVAEMAAAQARGEDVARVHSGDPSIYGAIAEQMRRLDALDPRRLEPRRPLASLDELHAAVEPIDVEALVARGLAEMARVLEPDDFRAWFAAYLPQLADRAHRIKGGAANVGAEHLATLCSELNSEGRATPLTASGPRASSRN